MKLEDLQHTNVLARPADNKRTVPDGVYNGELTKAEYLERDSKYSDDGKRVVLNLKAEVKDEEGEIVDLYIAPNYSWSKRGEMMKILEKLDALPTPGESIDLAELVGIPVQVIVENVEKDGETYSNIVSIERIEVAQLQRTIQKKSIPKKSISNDRVDAILDEDGFIKIADDFDDLFDED